MTTSSAIVTIEQLEQRVHELERQFAEMRCVLRPSKPLSSVADTFGMFAADPQFDEVVRLGREYQQQVNDEKQ